jgi:DNA-binding NarL/FixJ family response regulator
LRRADGEYRWFLIRTVPLRDEWGNIIKWYGASTDIEDRKQAEETLRRNQAFFAAEARRIGALLRKLTSDPRLEHSAGGGVAAADLESAAGASPPGAGAADRTIPTERRMAAERRAIESLTSHERAIMRLITEGKSNAEVGELLHLSPRTVETYRGRLMQKLQVEDLVALVKFAIRHGVASVE